MASQERKKQRKPLRPATTPEAREGQLVALATNLAEQQLRDGSASAQVITHYLRHGSTREKLEQQRLQNELLLTTAKIEQMQSQARVEELYSQALSAMKSYAGNDEDEDEDV
jgi:phage repressor protein C with HTH and peptisase S24 domain